MLKYHLFLSSGSPQHNGYQGSFETVDAAEATLPILNITVTDEMWGTLYETQDDGGLLNVRVYLRFPKFGSHWQAKHTNTGDRGRGYNIGKKAKLEGPNEPG